MKSERIRWIAAAALAVAAAAAPAGGDPPRDSLYASTWEAGNRMFWTPTRESAGKERAREENAWVALYNGRDLSGWHVKNGRLASWKADGEMISCVASGGGWLTSDREYGDFELRVEYRIPPGGNSGIGIRYPEEGDPAHAGMEIQVLDDAAPQYRNLKPAQYNGGIYYQAAPSRKAAKPPGEWNRYEIRCNGSRVRVKLNGIVIQDVDVAEFTKAEGNYTPLARRPRRGFVGMQSHGDRVDFRNIRIREM
jgi:hypothetical protein